MQAEGLTLSRVWGTNAGHKYTPEGMKEVSRFVDDVVATGKTLFPDTIHFTTRSLRFNRGPAIEVLGLEQQWQRADARDSMSDPFPILTLARISKQRWVARATSPCRPATSRAKRPRRAGSRIAGNSPVASPCGAAARATLFSDRHLAGTMPLVLGSTRAPRVFREGAEHGTRGACAPFQRHGFGSEPGAFMVRWWAGQPRPS